MAASKQAQAAADTMDPVYEWLDDGDSYLLRLNLPEFKKEDFRVHVDAEGRLTVIGHRRPAPGAAEGKAARVNKAFQLPKTANLDAVSGRFDGTVLTLKVPKLQQPAAGDADAAPLPPPPAPATTEEAHVPDGGKAPSGQENKAARGKEEDEKANNPVAPPPPSQPVEKVVARGGGDRGGDDQEEKARAEHKEKMAREAARRIEAARARVAEAKAKAERERQCEHWKDRAMEEGLKLADVVNRKEVIATAVAAFTFGVFVSQKLFSKSSN
ncbi:unnamed protein product [Urochloa humidicola]